MPRLSSFQSWAARLRESQRGVRQDRGAGHFAFSPSRYPICERSWRVASRTSMSRTFVLRPMRHRSVRRVGPLSVSAPRPSLWTSSAQLMFSLPSGTATAASSLPKVPSPTSSCSRRASRSVFFWMASAGTGVWFRIHVRVPRTCGPRRASRLCMSAACPWNWRAACRVARVPPDRALIYPHQRRRGRPARLTREALHR